MTINELHTMMERHYHNRGNPSAQGHREELMARQHDSMIEAIIEYLEEQLTKCNCEVNCPVHGISAQLDRTQME